MSDKLTDIIKKQARSIGKAVSESKAGQIAQSALRNARIQQAIESSIREEEQAIAEYNRRASKADPKTAKVYKHIAKNEVHHKQELTNRLKQIR